MQADISVIGNPFRFFGITAEAMRSRMPSIRRRERRKPREEKKEK